MKILAVSSSPRKNGNSDLLCDRFLEGAAQAGQEVEKLRLAERDLRPCAACCGCGETHVCVQRDGMAEALEKVLAADVIVLAVPVYFYSMAAQMKIFIDRCYPRYTEIKNKQFYFIVTAAAPPAHRSGRDHRRTAGLSAVLTRGGGEGHRLWHRGLGQGGRAAPSGL